MSKRKSRKTCRRKFKSEEMVEVAMSHMRKPSSLASAWDTDRRTARRIQSTVALSTLQNQSDVSLDAMRKHVSKFPPDTSTKAKIFDAASERLIGNMAGKTTSSKQASSLWEIMMVKIRFTWSYITEDPQKIISMAYEATVPPIPILSTDAEHTHHAVEDHPSVKGLVEFGNLLSSVSAMPFDIREFDGAPANDRYYHNIMATQLAGPDLEVGSVCSNHFNNLVESLGLVLAGRIGDQKFTLLNDYYCCALNLRTGGHFVRLVLVVETVLRKKARVVDGHPPESAAAFVAEMKAQSGLKGKHCTFYILFIEALEMQGHLRSTICI